MKTVLFLMMLSAVSLISKEDILSHEKFREVYDSTTIESSKLSDIKGDDVSVVVVLGTWCSDSETHVPVFLKISEAMTFEFVDYFNTEKGFRENPEGVVQDFNIERVPTFVFLRNGEEIGRIVETPEKTLIDYIRRICGTKK